MAKKRVKQVKKVKTVEKDGRGFFLSAFLLLFSLVSVTAFFQQLSYIFFQSFNPYVFQGLTVIIMALVSAALMWQWRKWGVYLYFLTILVLIYTPMLESTTHVFSAFEYTSITIAMLVLDLIVFLIIRPKWHRFS